MILRQSVQIRVPIRLIDTSGNPVTGMLPANFSGSGAGLVKSDGTTATIALVNATNFWEIDSTNAPGLYHIQLTTTHTNTIGPTQLVVRPAATAFVTGVYSFTVESFQALQTGDSYARLGAPAGASHAADIAAVKTDTANIYSRIGAPAGASISADVAAIKSDTGTLTTRIPGTVQPQTGDSYARLGAPAGASVSADIAAVFARIGAPAGASIAADVAAVKSDTTTLTTRIPGTVQPQTGDSYARLGAPVGASISADIANAQTFLQRLKDWNEGKWVIVTSGPDVNKIVFYKPDGVTVLAKFSLFDANGNPTTVNPFTRTP